MDASGTVQAERERAQKINCMVYGATGSGYKCYCLRRNRLAIVKTGVKGLGFVSVGEGGLSSSQLVVYHELKCNCSIVQYYKIIIKK